MVRVPCHKTGCHDEDRFSQGFSRDGGAHPLQDATSSTRRHDITNEATRHSFPAYDASSNFKFVLNLGGVEGFGAFARQCMHDGIKNGRLNKNVNPNVRLTTLVTDSGGQQRQLKAKSGMMKKRKYKNKRKMIE